MGPDSITTKPGPARAAQSPRPPLHLQPARRLTLSGPAAPPEQIPNPLSMSTLLKLQIGPVQEFIAQSRSTRDLWSGSYLLSWLMAAGISKLLRELAERANKTPREFMDVVVYPKLHGQPLVERRLAVDMRETDLPKADNEAVLTPNLPNILVAVLELDEAEATTVALAVERAMAAEWKDRIAAACWQKALKAGVLQETDKTRFDAQVDRFLSVSWQVSPFDDACYAKDYNRASLRLDAVRQTRPFRAWGTGGWEVGQRQNKDTLTGREEALLGGKEWWSAPRPGVNRLWNVLLRRKHEGDLLGAITLVKRTWRWAYLNDPKWNLSPLHVSEASPWPTGFPFPSTFHIARHDPSKTETDNDREPGEDTDRLSRYFAVLAFDGDWVGQWVGGSLHALDQRYHRDFSGRLGTFALECVRPIVAACDGRLIYAGGDDVLALLPADTALECAKFLRQAYRGNPAFIPSLTDLAKDLLADHLKNNRCLPNGHRQEISPLLVKCADGNLFKDIAGRLGLAGTAEPLDLPGELEGNSGTNSPIRPDASVGIAAAHFKNPLQDVIREAQAAEKRAKRSTARGGLDRQAVAITLIKRSGETVEWGCKWDSGGLDVYSAVHAAIREGAVSAKFPHRVCELLEGYRTLTTPLAASSIEPIPEFPAVEVLLREFNHALDRQGQDKESVRFRRLRQLAEDSDPNNRALELYLKSEKHRAEVALADANANPDRWACLGDAGRNLLERAPAEAPIAALIGLMKTAAFTQTPVADDDDAKQQTP